MKYREVMEAFIEWCRRNGGRVVEEGNKVSCEFDRELTTEFTYYCKHDQTKKSGRDCNFMLGEYPASAWVWLEHKYKPYLRFDNVGYVDPGIKGAVVELFEINAYPQDYDVSFKLRVKGIEIEFMEEYEKMNIVFYG